MHTIHTWRTPRVARILWIETCWRKWTSRFVGKPPVRSDFAALLADVKGRIQVAQTRAVLAVNAELVRLYWDVGHIIDARQKREGWGAGVIPRLARALKKELPELKGFSERNIDRMIAFYRQYSRQSEISPPAVAKLQSQKALQPALALVANAGVHGR